MGNRSGVWWIGPDGSLVSKSHGFALSVRQSNARGRTMYVVMRDHSDVDTQSRILAFGYEQSAIEGMEAAEKAVIRLLQLPPERWGLETEAANPLSLPLLLARMPPPKAPAAQSPEPAPKMPRQRRKPRHDASDSIKPVVGAEQQQHAPRPQRISELFRDFPHQADTFEHQARAARKK